MIVHDWPGWIDLLFKVLAAIGGLAGMIGGMTMALARRTFATKDELQERFRDHQDKHADLDKQLAAGAEEFAAIKADLAHLPDHKDIAEVKQRISDVEGSVKALTATIEGLREVLKRVEGPLNIIVKHKLEGGER